MAKKTTSSVLEQENTRLKKQLAEAEDKIKSGSDLVELERQKEEFISMAAHEIRAPLTAIKGYLSMMMDGDAGEIPEKASGFLTDASAITDRVIRLVNNMLNVSRIEEGRLIYQLKYVKLSSVAKQVFDQSKHEAERKGLSFTLEVPSDINDQVHADPDRIFEVVANIVSNALKYTNKGSVLIKLSEPKEGTVRLEVKDTGPGISEEARKKLFRKFYRVKSTVGKTIGTGLGLYICKLLVEKFEGTIGVESGVDKGSNFWFELPVKKKLKN